MKRILYLCFGIFGILLLLNTNTYAQEAGNLKVGGGPIYGTEAEAIGIQAGAKYDFTEVISGSASFGIFFPQNYDWWELNADGHYHFLKETDLNVYGLAGLNYTTFSIDFGPAGSVSNSEVGLNIGGGAEFGINFADFYTELKYVLGNADQLALSAGLRFGI